jgi:NADH:ubiquinone oxidoreductase subunit 4 (subunit M)
MFFDTILDKFYDLYIALTDSFTNTSTLLYIILVPLLGSILVLFTPSSKEKLIHQIGLYTSLITFLLSIFL